MRISDWSSDVCSSDLTDAPDLGPLGNCIIDLNDDCHEARLEFRFGPKATAPEAFFADHLIPLEDAADDRSRFFRNLSQRLPSAYAGTLEAVDPNDAINRKLLDRKSTRLNSSH